ncbi:MAG: HlyD family secretion protein [bacterium]
MRSKREEERAAPSVEEPPAPQLAASPQPRHDAPSPPEEAAPEEETRQRAGGRRGLRLFLVLLLILGGAAGYGGHWWYLVRGTVSTDDAYVDARIVSVASRLPERVDAVLVREGQYVKRGQVLMRLASDQLRIRVRQRQAALQGAAALLKEKRNSPRPEEVEVARAEVRVYMVERNQQENEVARALRLDRVNAISAQELERRRSAQQSARSRLEVGRRRLSLLLAGASEGEIRRAVADRNLARARLQAARTELADSRLRSPVEGVVAKRMVDPGEVVQKGQAVFQIVEAGKSWVVANLEEDQISRIREGQSVRIWIDAYPDREFKGRVGSLYAATLSRFSLLPTSSASGSFIKVTQRVPVRIDWAQDDLPPMFPGLNVIVRIQTGRR